MSRPRLLYLSINDGTDTRIAKEIRSLASSFDITFVGVRQEDNGVNQLPSGVRQVVIPGRRRDPMTLARLFVAVYRLGPSRFESVHVVNENLLLILAPLLLTSKNLVLDVFDSMFLKNGLLPRLFRWPLQWFAHVLADTVLVTDPERRRLIPVYLRGNVDVLPNFPVYSESARPRRITMPGDPLRIFFSGSLASGRGIPFLEDLLASSPAVEVVAAGWIYDDAARRLCSRERVSYQGIVSAEQAAKIACSCDFILCLYSPDVPNNIHASPNKIYDAALIGMPVIINAEVNASEFVQSQGLGYVLQSYRPNDPAAELSALLAYRDSRAGVFQGTPPPRWVWQSVEGCLLKSHLYPS